MNNILFNVPMTKAIESNIKTVTRRTMKQPPVDLEFKNMQGFDNICALFDNSSSSSSSSSFDYKFHCVKSPYKIGQILWIREKAKVLSYSNLYMEVQYLSDGFIKNIRIPDRFLELTKDKNESIKTWNPIPKWINKFQGIPNGCFKEMARTYIIITGIRVERLNEISIEDAKSEGIELLFDNVLTEQNFYPRYDLKELFPYFHEKEAVKSFASLWESISGKGSFNNQWVLVINFKKLSEEDILNIKNL